MSDALFLVAFLGAVLVIVKLFNILNRTQSEKDKSDIGRLLLRMSPEEAIKKLERHIRPNTSVDGKPADGDPN